MNKSEKLQLDSTRFALKLLWSYCRMKRLADIPLTNSFTQPEKYVLQAISSIQTKRKTIFDSADYMFEEQVLCI